MEDAITAEQIKAMTKDERAKLIEETERKLKDAYDELKKMDEDIHNVLVGEINVLTNFKINVSKPYITEPWRIEKNGHYEIYTSVSFINENGETDFGSGFELTVYENFISADHGTNGTFTSKDIYQVERLNLMSQIFKNENEIVEKIKEHVDMSKYEKKCRLRAIIDEVKHINCIEEREAEKAKAVASITVGAIFKQTEFHEGTGCGWFFKIISITDKTITCEQLHKYYEYDYEKREYKEEPTFHHYNIKRIKKEDFIYKVLGNSYVKEETNN